MRGLARFLLFFMAIVFLAVVAIIVTKYYSWIFSKDIEGQVFQIERVTEPSLMLGSGMVNSGRALHSFAVAIRTKDGKIYTASSEDRQWAVVRRGICVEAKFYPYPVWDLEKGGTYQNARLIAMKECPPDMDKLPEPLEPSAPVETPADAPAESL